MAPNPAWTASRFAKRIFGHVDCGHRHMASENMPNRNVGAGRSLIPLPAEGAGRCPRQHAPIYPEPYFGRPFRGLSHTRF